MLLPKEINKIIVPPIKCQGIKTKLVPFIASSIKWSGKGYWLEPFLGSGVVLFNINPDKAIISDKNEHIINFYKDIQNNKVNSRIAREYLEYHGNELSNKGEEYYYEIRDKFNRDKESLDFLFLTRSCFNGVMRFNSKGNFNVPFCKKNDRFQKAYVTKIVNQIKNIECIIMNKDWTFISCDWRDLFEKATFGDFIYLDPPYIGRHTGYVGDWTEEEAHELSVYARETQAGFALSMWRENKYRKNEHLDNSWSGYSSYDFDHFYHVGSSEDLRNKMIETLIMKEGYIAEKDIPQPQVDCIQELEFTFPILSAK